MNIPRFPRKTLTATLIAAAALVGLAGPASACHPDLEVTVDCEHIAVTATPWASDDASQRINRDVQVTVDGTVVARGPLSPTSTLSATVTAAPGVHTVVVTAMAPWGPAGEHGDAGSTVTRTVEVPWCIDHEVTWPPTTSVEVVDAVTSSTPVVERTVEPVVAGVVERPTVLAFTGGHTRVLAIAGGVLVVVGLVLLPSGDVERSEGPVTRP